jgi:hypothetical protein
MGIALVEGSSFKILRKYFLLEDFGDPEFSSSFHFESFELLYFVIEVKHNVPFLKHLSVMLLDIKLGCFLFLLGCWNHHCFIGTINLEENSHFFAITILPLFGVLKPLILLIGVLIINEMVEYMARI